MNVYSPIISGSGVQVVHQQLAAEIPGYQVDLVSPKLTLFPPLLRAGHSTNADLIHTSADYGVFFARAKIPMVVTVHNYTSDPAMRRYSSTLQYLHYRSDLRWFTQLTLARSQAVVAVSDYMVRMLRQDLGYRGPVERIYNGVDTARFTPADRERHGQPCRILFCGNLHRRKRAHLLQPLARELGPGFEIWFTRGLGNSPKPAIEDAGAAARLYCVGRIEHAEMPRLYADIDILFMPSVREGFGLCVAEAMACGLPVVAADSSATPELVHHGKGGYLCAPDDLAGFADAIKRLAATAALRERMGIYNRERVERHFALADMVFAYRQLFSQLTQGVSGGDR